MSTKNPLSNKNNASIHETQEDIAPFAKGGEYVRLTKQSINEGQTSALSVGTMLEGRLMGDVKIGKSIRFMDGGNTSPVQRIRQEAEKVIVETATSTYVLEPLPKDAG